MKRSERTKEKKKIEGGEGGDLVFATLETGASRLIEIMQGGCGFCFGVLYARMLSNQVKMASNNNTKSTTKPFS